MLKQLKVLDWRYGPAGTLAKTEEIVISGPVA